MSQSKHPVRRAARLLAYICAAVLWGSSSLADDMTTMTYTVTNNSGVDLTFELKEDSKKHIKFSPKTDGENWVKIANGKTGTITLTPTGNRCLPTCDSCFPSKGRVRVYYEENGKLVMNNYFLAKYEFWQSCSVSGNTTILVYGSEWDFEHHKGDGNDKYAHSQSHHSPSVSTKDPATGNTFSAKKTAATATISYP